MFFGIIFFALSYSVLYLFPIRARRAFFIVLTIHAFIILFYAYSGLEIIGSTEDADSFYKHAIEKSKDISNLNWSISALSNGHEFFKNMHALLQYHLSGPEKILSYSTSLIVWSLCTLILARLYLSFCKDDFDGLNVLIYLFSLTPSILIFNSFLLREVWMSLFIFLILFSAVNIKNYQKKFFTILLIGLISIFFHRFMIVITMVTLTMVLFYDAILKYEWYPFDNLKIFSYLALLLITGFILLSLNLDAVQLFKNNGILGAIDQYSIGLIGGHGDGAPPARASYGKVFDKDNIFSIIQLFLTYQFMPYPWRVSSIFDLLPLFENFLRLLLVLLFILNRKNLLKSQKMNLDMIFLIWLSTELIWSLGTINWGTAYRHHAVAYGLLVLVSIVAYRSNKSKIQ